MGLKCALGWLNRPSPPSRWFLPRLGSFFLDDWLRSYVRDQHPRHVGGAKFNAIVRQSKKLKDPWGSRQGFNGRNSCQSKSPGTINGVCRRFDDGVLRGIIRLGFSGGVWVNIDRWSAYCSGVRDGGTSRSHPSKRNVSAPSRLPTKRRTVTPRSAIALQIASLAASSVTPAATTRLSASASRSHSGTSAIEPPPTADMRGQRGASRMRW